MVSAPGGESAVVSPPVVSPPGDELAGNRMHILLYYNVYLPNPSLLFNVTKNRRESTALEVFGATKTAI